MTGKRPGFGRHVPRESVHKVADAEVLLTDAVRPDPGEDRFTVAALWQRGQFLGHRGAGAPADPLLLAETVRQAAIYVSHSFLSVPLGQSFILYELGIELENPLPRVEDAPLPLVLDTTCRRTGPNPSRTRWRLDAELWIRDRFVGRAAMHWEAMEPGRYQMIRKRSATAAPPVTVPQRTTGGTAPLPPASVGYRSDDDVLLAADSQQPDRWWLRMNPDHPVLFDHMSDHVPGMVLLEAFRQVGRVVAPGSSDLTSLAAEFTSFGELAAPVAITAQRVVGENGGPVFRLLATQGGRELARATLNAETPCAAVTGRAGAAC